MLAERVLMGLLIGAIAIGCIFVLYPFLSAILWAAILVFTTWPVFVWLSTRLRLRRMGAATAMVLITTVLIVLPIALAAPAGADDVTSLRRSAEDFFSAGLPGAPYWVADLPLVGKLVSDTWNQWAADLSAMTAFFKPYFGLLAENAFSLFVRIAGGLLNFLLALFVAFFFWVSGDALGAALTTLIGRIAGPYADRLIDVTGQTVRGTVYGILGTAIVQGLLTSFGLYLAHVPRPLLLGTLAGLLSVLPIGAPVVWIPAALWLLSTGHTAWGIFLGIYGVVAVSGADSVIRPFFISRGTQLPFLLTALGVLGGALAFGLVGIFVGPVLLGVGFTLVAEFMRIEREASTPNLILPE